MSIGQVFSVELLQSPEPKVDDCPPLYEEGDSFPSSYRPGLQLQWQLPSTVPPQAGAAVGPVISAPSRRSPPVPDALIDFLLRSSLSVAL